MGSGIGAAALAGVQPRPAAAGGRREAGAPLNRRLAREEAGARAPRGRRGKSLTEQVRGSAGRAAGASFSHGPSLCHGPIT